MPGFYTVSLLHDEPGGLRNIIFDAFGKVVGLLLLAGNPFDLGLRFSLLGLAGLRSVLRCCDGEHGRDRGLGLVWMRGRRQLVEGKTILNRAHFSFVKS